jgi:hypothetical protein
MNTTTPVINSLNERIASAALVLGKSTDQIELELSAILGPKSEEWVELMSSEEFTKFGDFMKALKDDSEKPSPIAVVRKAVSILRGPEEKVKSESSPRAQELTEALGVKPTMGSADTLDLLALYLPGKSEDPVSRELAKRYGDKAVIAFSPGTTEVAVAETIAYVTDLQQGMPSQESIMVGGSLSRLYPVGKKPVGTVGEDPLFNGRPLTAQGRSTVNHINWSEVKTPARQFVRILVERGDIKTDDRLNLIEIVKKASENVDSLGEVFPEAKLDFLERKEDGTLPNLKVRLNGQSKNNSPFTGHNRTR